MSMGVKLYKTFEILLIIITQNTTQQHELGKC